MSLYCSHFGFIESPFSIAPDFRFLYLTKRHEEALAHLIYGIQEGNGLLLFTGDIGTGKTTVLRYLLEKLPSHTQVALILNPKLSERELLETICDELAIERSQNSRSFKELLDLLNHHLLNTYQAGGHTVLVIDEAQHLSPDLLESIRLLTNLETQKRKLLQIVLVGQPELRHLLEHPNLKQVAQRIVARYHLTPLSKQETKGYIAHRLKIAGHSGHLFSTSAFRKIFFLTQGVPRLINILCERCLIAAFATNRFKISARLVKKSSKEIFGIKKNAGFYWRLCILLFGFLVIAGISSLWVWQKTKQPVLTPYFQKTESRDIQVAYRTLFALTGIFLPDHVITEAQICRFAEENKLQCKKERTSLDQLRFWNQPGILRLYDKAEQPYFGVFIRLTEKHVVLAIGNEHITLSSEDLMQYWRGEYDILRPRFN